jgi:23S rRNA (cytosine1962-C5)-methyltransferase
MRDTTRSTLEARLPLFDDRQAVRLSHHELLSGLTIDDYAGHLLLTDYRGHDRERLTDLAERLLAALNKLGLPAIGATMKRRPDDLAHEGVHTDSDGVLLAGDPPPDAFTVNERGMIFEISFTEGGFATGLFLDMVEGRQAVHNVCRRAHANDKRLHVLNLFSYTGPFSIAATSGGAAEVIEVDTSTKWLGWAQRNQKHNDLWGIGVIRQRADDAVKFLSKQEDESFDLIVCDPPSYANPKRGDRFTVEAGYRRMSRYFERVLPRGGWLLACCNHAQTTMDEFRRWLPPRFELEKRIDPPPDFPGAGYLKALLLRRP